jgi:hypothetical protein
VRLCHRPPTLFGRLATGALLLRRLHVCAGARAPAAAPASTRSARRHVVSQGSETRKPGGGQQRIILPPHLVLSQPAQASTLPAARPACAADEGLRAVRCGGAAAVCAHAAQPRFRLRPAPACALPACGCGRVLGGTAVVSWRERGAARGWRAAGPARRRAAARRAAQRVGPSAVAAGRLASARAQASRWRRVFAAGCGAVRTVARERRGARAAGS